MSFRSAPGAGFTLLELLIALVLVSLLASLATPAFHEAILTARARAALNQLSSDIYRARMLAVEGGYPVHVILQPGPDGCAASIRTAREGADGSRTVLDRTALELTNLCLIHSGDSVLVFDNRGLLRPPARSFSVTHGGITDQVLLSIAGRLRRTF
jgi:prepilin-type N-terminal cleavage/methylation domain-containing protein